MPEFGTSQQGVNASSGFTLIELMVTIAVLTIVITVAVPSFTSLVTSSRLNAQANQLLAAIEYAKTEAVKNNATVIFCHSADGNSCTVPPAASWQGWLVGRAAVGTGIEADSVMRSGRLESTQLVIRPSADINDADNQIRITPQGLLRSTNRMPLAGTLRVCAPGSSVNPNSRNLRIRSGGQLAVISEQQAGCPIP